MARKLNQKRTETISVRITPELKEKITILSNCWETSISNIIEGAIDAGFKICSIKIEDINGELKYQNKQKGNVEFNDVMEIVKDTEPFITQLRLFYVMPKGLNEKQIIIANAITSSQIFHGKKPIFKNSYLIDNISIPKINLETIKEHQESLESYADFMIHNTQRLTETLPINYETYLKLKNGEKITITLNDLLPNEKTNKTPR